MPVLFGAYLNSTFPKTVARLAPASALLAVLVVALICASVMGANASAVLSAGPALLGAVVALHAGEGRDQDRNSSPSVIGI